MKKSSVIRRESRAYARRAPNGDRRTVRDAGVERSSTRLCKRLAVPLTGYFVTVGSVLVVLLFISDWYLPEPPSAFPSHAQLRSSWPGGTGRCVGGRRSDRHEAPPI